MRTFVEKNSSGCGGSLEKKNKMSRKKVLGLWIKWIIRHLAGGGSVTRIQDSSWGRGLCLFQKKQKTYIP